MSLFGKLVRTVVNVAELPVAVAKDVLTLGGTVTEQNPTGHGKTYTREQLERLKDEAED
jgi:hypothetical protein